VRKGGLGGLGTRRPPEAKAFFVNECLNFDVLVTAKIPYQKIGSAEKKGAGASPPPKYVPGDEFGSCDQISLS